MSEEQVKELQKYNLEYLEAQQSEEIFGGDYTSAVELKYVKEEIERLNQYIDFYKDLTEKQNKSLGRLNNIINEFERLLQQDLENEKDTYWTNITIKDYIQFMLNKLRELKGSESNE